MKIAKWWSESTMKLMKLFIESSISEKVLIGLVIGLLYLMLRAIIKG